MAGVSLRTVYRRLSDTDFADRLEEARNELVAATLGRLLGSASRAADAMSDLLDVKYPPTVRLGAARSILDAAQRWRTAEDLVSRLDSIEAALTANGDRDLRRGTLDDRRVCAGQALVGGRRQP